MGKPFKLFSKRKERKEENEKENKKERINKKRKY
jgi:hypothetical protein